MERGIYFLFFFIFFLNIFNLNNSPISDWFGFINLDIVTSVNEGWIKENYQEKILGSVKIPVQDFLSRNWDYVMEKI